MQKAPCFGYHCKRLGNLITVVSVLAAGSPAQAQSRARPNPFQGFAGSNNQPINVTSESIEVYTNKQRAVFIGKIVAKQGESVLRTPRLTIYYDQASSPGSTPAGRAADKSNAVRRLEASGGVVVTAADQKAIGAKGVFDRRANTATLTGHVVLTQGPDVVRGSQLQVNLTTGISRVTGDATALFVPKSGQGGARARPRR